MTLSCYQLCHIFVLLFLVDVILAETMHLKRNFEDAEKFNMWPKHKNKENIDDAEVQDYLNKFGFMNCQTPALKRRRRETMRLFGKTKVSRSKPSGNSFLPQAHEVTDALSESDCSADQLKMAVSKLQKTFGLNVTGELDNKTLELMSMPRCGNSDKDIVQNITALTDDENLDGDLDTNVSLLKSNHTASNVSTNGTQDDTLDGTTPTSSGQDSILLSTIAPTVATGLSHRRKRQVNDIIQKLLSETPRELKKRAKIIHMQRKRSKRSVMLGPSGVSIGHAVGSQTVITWRLIHPSRHIYSINLRGLITMAFRMWSEVSPLTFTELQPGTAEHINDVDIIISFGTGWHLYCDFPFDGPGHTVAHSVSLNNKVQIHLDDSENFVQTVVNTNSNQVNTHLVLLHEIGHSIGIQHIAFHAAVMRPQYSNVIQDNSELSEVDRMMATNKLGPCVSKLWTAFDWVRVRPDGNVVYNSYFFADKNYWMYLNSRHRPRYGDPLEIEVEWRGLPEGIDTYLHLWYEDHSSSLSPTTVNEQYFIRGDSLYLYDPLEDRVQGTRTIQSKFGNEIPSNLNSACFDFRGRRQVYFFKDDMVYTYNVFTKEVTTQKFEDQFPTLPYNLPPTGPLKGHIDACYYSFSTGQQYFLKDDEVWKNECYNEREGQIENCLLYIGRRSYRWQYLCEV